MKEKYNRLIKLIPLLILLLLTYLLFIPKLGQTPLRSWDEAWYAEIARNILKTGNWFLLQWNGLPYYDHPPFGFWLMALSFKTFGINEFSARFPSAIAGIVSILLIYAIGKELFERKVGFLAGIILATMPWFWLRSREGNLDILLTFLMLLSLWLSLKVPKNEKLLPVLVITFGFALLTKSVIGLGLLPVILYIVLTSRLKFTKKSLFFTAGCLLLTLLPWYLTNFSHYGMKFIDRNIFVTGLKLPGYGALWSKNSNIMPNFKNSFNQIHMGILLWYKPFLVSLMGSLLFLKQKPFRILMVWLLPYLILFSSSPKVELWHFIILYPVISLLSSAFFLKITEEVIKKLLALYKKKYFNIPIVAAFSFLFTSVFVIWNGNRIVKGLSKDIIKNQPINDEVVLSKIAGERQGTIYIDDDYWPTAVFYAERKVYSIPHSTDTNIKSVKQLFLEEKKPLLLLTKKWILDRDKIDPNYYITLKQIGDRVLIQTR